MGVWTRTAWIDCKALSYVRRPEREIVLKVGIDIGGTKIAGGVVDQDGHIVEQLRVDTPTDTDALAPHDGAELVDHRPGDLRPADVDTDRVHQEAAFRRG